MTEHDALVDNTDAKGWHVNPLFGSYCRKRKVPSIKKTLKKPLKSIHGSTYLNILLKNQKNDQMYIECFEMLILIKRNLE